MKKKVLSSLLALSLCVSMSLTVFADDSVNTIVVETGTEEAADQAVEEETQDPVIDETEAVTNDASEADTTEDTTDENKAVNEPTEEAINTQDAESVENEQTDIVEENIADSVETETNEEAEEQEEITDTVTVAGSTIDSRYYCESDHPYAANTDQEWVVGDSENSQITSLKLYFDGSTEFESGYDYLEIYSSSTGTRIGRYTGTELAGQIITVSDNSAILKMTSDSSENEWGFAVKVVPTISREAIDESEWTRVDAVDNYTNDVITTLCMNRVVDLYEVVLPYGWDIDDYDNIGVQYSNPDVAYLYGPYSSGNTISIACGDKNGETDLIVCNYATKQYVKINVRVAEFTFKNGTNRTAYRGGSQITVSATVDTGASDWGAVTYVSQNTDIFKIDKTTGKVTALKAGSGQGYAEVGGVKNYFFITVKSAALSKSSASVYLKKTLQLSVSNGYSVSWSSSNSAVASVSSKGLVTAKKAGTAYIYATTGASGGRVKLSCKITVKKPAISVTSATTYVGMSKKLSVAGGSGTITWKSSKKSVATVTSSGVVSAKASGTAYIYATRNGYTSKCKITVKKNAVYYSVNTNAGYYDSYSDTLAVKSMYFDKYHNLYIDTYGINTHLYNILKYDRIHFTIKTKSGGSVIADYTWKNISKYISSYSSKRMVLKIPASKVKIKNIHLTSAIDWAWTYTYTYRY